MIDNKFNVGDIVRRTIKSLWPEQYGEVDVEYEVLGLRGSCIVVVAGGSGADSEYFDLVTTDNNRNNLETTAMTASKFTETVTTTKTTIKEVINGRLSNNASMSVSPSSVKGDILIVVGARYGDRYCASFDKPSLQELINELQTIHDAMENK